MIQKKINMLLFIVGLLFISMNNIYAQAAIDIPITISDNAGGSKVINFGLDPTATDGIDPALGESDLPPFPPAGVFEARFWLPPFAASSLTSYRDYRNAPAFPFTGPKSHRVKWQYTDLATSITFTYNLPAGVQITITQNATTPTWTSGPRTGSGSFTFDDPDNLTLAARINVEYTNVAPIVLGPTFAIAPASLSFGTVNVGNNAVLPVTVSNPGTAPLTITGVVSSAAQYTFAPSVFPLVIPVGGNSVLNVTFTPTAAGVVPGTLTFTHNAPGSPTVYNLTGTGYVPAPVIGFSPASLSFGSIAVGGNAVLPLTVNNTGDAQLTLTNIVSSNGQYTFAPNAFPVNIAAGGNAVFNVTFTPTAAGPQNANLTFTHNAAGSPSNYVLTGTGFTTAPLFSLNPASLNFGQVSVGGNAVLPVTVNNTGNAQLTISGVVASGPFTFAPNTFPINIAANGTAVFNVTFTPTVSGVVNGNLTFTHNAAGSPSVLPLQGEGRTQGGLLKFITSSRIIYDNHLNYQDTVVLSGYTGQPLKALQFDILIGNVNGFLKFNSASRGAAIPAPNFFFDYQVYQGAIRTDGSRIDTLRVVILGNTNNVIAPNGPDQHILTFSYDVVSITTPSATTYNSIVRVVGATETPVRDANITPGPWETLNIFNGTTDGLLGDVNLDNQVDLADILLMIDYILGRTTFNAQQMLQGDIAPWLAPAPLPTRDGVVNVLDLAVLQNIVLTGLYPNGNPVNKVVGNPFMISNLQKMTPGMDAKLTFLLSKNGITVGLETARKVKGVQIEMNGVSSYIPTNTPISSVFDTKVYYQLNDFLRTLTYDGQSLPMDAGEYLLANIPFSLSSPKDIEISKIIVIDENNSKMEKVEVEIQYDEIIPLDYSLSQNFPNPFNPTTSVEFSVPVDGFVTIKVYDMLGQAVADLYSGNAQAGTYTLNWDGKDNSGNAVSSGSYIYKMTAGDFVQSKKMTFLK